MNIKEKLKIWGKDPIAIITGYFSNGIMYSICKTLGKKPPKKFMIVKFVKKGEDFLFYRDTKKEVIEFIQNEEKKNQK